MLFKYIQGDPKKSIRIWLSISQTAIFKIQTKCFASTKRKANLNFGVSFMKFESIFVVSWPFKIKNHFQNYWKKDKKRWSNYWDYILFLKHLKFTKGLFLSAVQTVYLHPKSAICISFSHLRQLGRRPGHPSNFSDGWTASETEISKKSKTHLGRPSFAFLSAVWRRCLVVLSKLYVTSGTFMVYRVFDGCCLYDLITNGRFVQLNFTFTFVFTLKPPVSLTQHFCHLLDFPYRSQH